MERGIFSASLVVLNVHQPLNGIKGSSARRDGRRDTLVTVQQDCVACCPLENEKKGRLSLTLKMGLKSYFTAEEMKVLQNAAVIPLRFSVSHFLLLTS